MPGLAKLQSPSKAGRANPGVSSAGIEASPEGPGGQTLWGFRLLGLLGASSPLGSKEGWQASHLEPRTSEVEEILKLIAFGMRAILGHMASEGEGEGESPIAKALVSHHRPSRSKEEEERETERGRGGEG